MSYPILLEFIIPFWFLTDIIIIGVIAHKTGRKVWVWIRNGLLSMLIALVGVFLLSSQFYPCNGETCTPWEVGCFAGLVAPLFIIWIMVMRKDELLN